MDTANLDYVRNSSYHMDYQLKQIIVLWYIAYLKASPDPKVNLFSDAVRPLTKTETQMLSWVNDDTKVAEVLKRPLVTALDLLNAQIADAAAEFFHSLSIESDDTLPPEFLNKFNQEKAQRVDSFTAKVQNEIRNCLIRGESINDVTQSVSAIVSTSAGSWLETLKYYDDLFSSAATLNERIKEGFTHCVHSSYNIEKACDDCKRLYNQVFTLEEILKNPDLVPKHHPNCNCLLIVGDERLAAAEIPAGAGIPSGQANKEETSIVDTILDVGQFALDIAGLIPAIGEVADLINAGIYTARGDYLNAGLSLASAIPFAGWISAAGKLGGKAVKGILKGADKISDAAKIIDDVADAAKVVDDITDAARAVDNATDAGKIIIKNADDVIQGAGKVNIDDVQFGKKIGKHAQDYGLNPADPNARNILRNKINDIYGNATEIRQGEWMGLGEKLPSGANAPGQAKFYIQGNDVVVSDMNGNFVTIMKDGINNLRVQGATRIWP